MTTQRTNYFKVTDEEKFLTLISKLQSDDGSVVTWGKVAEDGTVLHAFGANGNISYWPDAEDGTAAKEPVSWDEFAEDLSEILPEGEALILVETNADKLRSVTGYAEIITRYEHELIDLRLAALTEARQLLKNESWTTCMDY